MVFEVGIGTSQNWDPKTAATEVITQATTKLSKPPTFVMLFSTIHYENNNGFQTILNTIYEKIPLQTPLTGGTVVGFMNNNGVYTRGLTALACYSDEISAVAGFGEHTKHNPKKAAQNCYNIIKEKMKTNKNRNLFLFENTSNGTIPKLPILGQKKILQIPFSKIAVKVLDFFNTTFGYGVGREDEVLDELSKMFSEYNILAAANYDDFKAFSNYQFYNSKVLSNSVSAIAIDTPLKVEINTTFGLKPTNKKVKISNKSFHECLFEKIDSRPATTEFLSKLGWDKNVLNENLYRKTNYYPIGYDDGKTIYPHVVGLVIGESLCFTYKFKEDDLTIYTTSGKEMINAINMNLQKHEEEKQNLKLALIVECAIRLETLGKHCYIIYEILSKFFQEKPFLLIYGAGEGTYTPKGKPAYYNLSFNVATFIEKK